LLRDLPESLLLVHDGARCFLTPEVIDRVIDGIIRHQACGAAVAVKDTIKQADAGGLVERTLDRSRLWAMQTPQGAWYRIMSQAYDLAEVNCWQTTDDLSLLELAGLPVYLVPGDYRNIKLTTPEDRLLGEQLALLADRASEADRIIDGQADVP
jgi:2-C-methyl-D-erythritol 4-phosphate cytidylyltransferase